ncbi:hypothetical protein PM082_010116 [Marasmius tenuissimus]|nr:hypothetical protein PM082_010116 [Marasmius tenuissimus]
MPNCKNPTSFSLFRKISWAASSVSSLLALWPQRLAFASVGYGESNGTAPHA